MPAQPFHCPIVWRPISVSKYLFEFFVSVSSLYVACMNMYVYVHVCVSLTEIVS